MIETQKRLFISYAHQDRNQVRYIVELLRAGGCDPWFDNQLVAGQRWQPQIVEQIRRCDVFIYILTPKSVTSDWCQWEFYEAVRLGKPVVPIMMRKATLTDALNRIHHVDFTGGQGGRDVAAAQLIHAVHQSVPILSPDEVPHVSPDPTSLPEQLLGTSGNHDTQPRLSPLDREKIAALDELLPVSESHSMTADGKKRPALLWWALIGVVVIAGLIIIRSGALSNPLVPPMTAAITQIPTSILDLPTSAVSDTPIADTPPAQTTATQQPSVTPTEMQSTPSATLDIPTITPDEGDSGDSDMSMPVSVIAEVSGTSVNLRSGPGSNFRVLDTAQQGEQFTVIAQSKEGWLLVGLANGSRGWIWSKLVTLSDEGALIPYAATIPAAPPVVVSNTPARSCNPGQWNSVCGSNGCGSEYVSQCNPQGTGYICVWNPQQCSSSTGPGTIFRPPIKPTAKPGDPTEVPFVCTESWLTAQLQDYANQMGISLQQLIQQLLPSYDINHNGQIDCYDYNILNGGS